MNANIPGVDRRDGSRCLVERSPLLPRRPSPLPTTTASGWPAVLATMTAETAAGRGYVTVWPVRVRRAGIGAAVILLLAGCTGSVNPPVDTGPATVTASAPASSAAAPTPSDTAAPSAVSDGALTRPVLSPSALPFPAQSSAALPAPQQGALQLALDAMVRDSTMVRGVTAAVVSPAGSWSGAAGVDANAARMVPDDMVGIASITKTVTAAEVLQLAQTGRIDLDAPASNYLSHRLLQDNPTVRQLLSHTSGVPDFATSAALFAAGVADPTRSWTADEVLSYVTDPVKAPGGAVRDYSGSNYLLLGMLIEKVTGLSYSQAVRRDVLSGVGDRMVVQDAERPTPPLAAADPSTGPVSDDFLPDRAVASVLGADGGIAADAPTVAGWGYRLYGGMVLPADRTVEMVTEVAPGYGLGTDILEQRSGPNGGAVGHHGGGSGYVTVLTVVPADHLSIAILAVGTDDSACDRAANAIIAAMQTN